MLSDFMLNLFSTSEFGSEFLIELIGFLLILEFIKICMEFCRGGWK